MSSPSRQRTSAFRSKHRRCLLTAVAVMTLLSVGVSGAIAKRAPKPSVKKTDPPAIVPKGSLPPKPDGLIRSRTRNRDQFEEKLRDVVTLY